MIEKPEDLRAYVESLPEREVRTFVLDLSETSSPLAVHLKIQEILELPERYGKNFDAFWDSITGIMYLPAHIIFTKSKSKSLEPMMDIFIKVLKRAEKQEYITLEIK